MTDPSAPSLSQIVVSLEDQLYSFEYAASIAETSTTVIQVYVELGIIEAIDDLLHAREIARIAQIRRLRRDLGVNLVGAAIVLDMAQEIAQLRARLQVYQADRNNQFERAERSKTP